MTTTTTDFPIPFSREQLRQDILAIHWLQMRVTSLFAEDSRVWALVGKPAERDGLLWALDLGPSAFELTHEDVASSVFAKALEQQYDYAFHGVLTDLLEPMEYETMHTWVAAHLLDLSVSRFVEECEGYGGPDFSGAIQRCLHTSELANARLALEERETFSYFNSARSDGKQDAATALDALTIRQIALLAGMEEMSVRTAASRKGPTQLQTYKEDMRTLVRVDDARAWLKAKGKYVSVTRRWLTEELRLEKTRFAGVGELYEALRAQLAYISNLPTAQGDPLKRLQAAFEDSGLEPAFVVNAEVTRNKALLSKIADVLSLPADLLILRAEQAQLNNDLWWVEKAITDRMQAPPANSP